MSYEYGRLLEDRLNTHFKTGHDSRVLVVFVPLPREMLASALIDGMVDVVAAQATIRPDLTKLADFSDPTRTNVAEIVVTGPDTPPVASVDDLSGKDVFARPRSAYRASLVALNAKFAKRGKLPVVIRDAPENLEDDDLLEMVNAGLLPAIVVDDYLAKFWSRPSLNITLHENVAVRTGGALAVAVRKKSPKLLAALNTIIGQYGLGTAFGNQVERKYLADTKYVRSATSESERAKFVALIQFFRQYGEQVRAGLHADGGPGIPGVTAQSGRARATWAPSASCK